MKKILVFEGAGWPGAEISRATDVGNCRIRTRLKNRRGRVIYLEMGCSHFDNPKYAPTWAKGFNYVAYIDFLYYCDSGEDNRNHFSKELQPLTSIHFEYNKENILKFVNEMLGCNFEDMIVYNNEVRVHDTIEPICSCAEDE